MRRAKLSLASPNVRCAAACSRLQRQHLVHQSDDAVVTGCVGWVIQIVTWNGDLGKVHWFLFEVAALLG